MNSWRTTVSSLSHPPYDLHTEAKTLTGWGRTQPSAAQVLSASNPEEIIRAVSMVAEDNETKPSYLKRGVIARGRGRSYGDPAANSGGLVIDMEPLNTIHSIDPDTALADVDAGVTSTS